MHVRLLSNALISTRPRHPSPLNLASLRRVSFRGEGTGVRGKLVPVFVAFVIWYLARLFPFPKLNGKVCA
jgi:hypothetical protein